jgi:hypothetical protein
MSEIVRRSQVVPALMQATKRDLRIVAASLVKIGNKINLTEEESLTIESMSRKMVSLAEEIEMLEELYYSGRTAEITW